MSRSLAILGVLFVLVSGCTAKPMQGGFQHVCDQLVAMGPAERSFNMGANQAYYSKTYGIYYDALTDAIYTKNASGGRDYILKGDIGRATFLIDNRKKDGQ